MGSSAALRRHRPVACNAVGPAVLLPGAGTATDDVQPRGFMGHARHHGLQAQLELLSRRGDFPKVSGGTEGVYGSRLGDAPDTGSIDRDARSEFASYSK